MNSKPSLETRVTYSEREEVIVGVIWGASVGEKDVGLRD